MGKTLTKDWNKTPAGTVITTDQREWNESLRHSTEPGTVLVDPARFAHLEAMGYFAVEADSPIKSRAARPADRRFAATEDKRLDPPAPSTPPDPEEV